jgi:DNA-binding NarL/FixJ family response regulator
MDYSITYAMTHEPSWPAGVELSTRQRQIFDLIVIGLSNKEIARTLGLGVGTVKIHARKLFGKLGVRNRGGVALAGTKLGLRSQMCSGVTN